MMESFSPITRWKAAWKNMMQQVKNNPTVQHVRSALKKYSANGDLDMGLGLLYLAAGVASKDKVLMYGGPYFMFRGFRENQRYIMRRVEAIENRGGSGLHVHLHPRPHPV